jgi:hypothetical protein
VHDGSSRVSLQGHGADPEQGDRHHRGQGRDHEQRNGHACDRDRIGDDGHGGHEDESEHVVHGLVEPSEQISRTTLHMEAVGRVEVVAHQVRRGVDHAPVDEAEGPPANGQTQHTLADERQADDDGKDDRQSAIVRIAQDPSDPIEGSRR